MSRVIKFRAFFDGEMIYGDQKPKPFYVCLHPSGALSIVLLFDKTMEPHFIGEGRLQALLQFTGLTDKNGKEIYEGDVCKFKHRDIEHTEIVRYGSAAFHLGIYITLYEAYLTKYNEIQYSLEVIGNIYSNPELLKS